MTAMINLLVRFEYAYARMPFTMTAGGATYYLAYDQAGSLRVIADGSDVVGEYAYDAFGRRVKKVASGVTTLYHYAGGNLIAETDGSGSTLRNYIYLNGQPAAVRIYGTQDGMYYFLNDHLGTPQKILDSSAQVVWAAAYLPFGKAQIKPETVTNNLRFPGQYFDAESGLHYNWHRYYDPETGRYLTPDPIGLAGGINLYTYVGGNPVNRTDPFGLIDFADEVSKLFLSPELDDIRKTPKGAELITLLESEEKKKGIPFTIHLFDKPGATRIGSHIYVNKDSRLCIRTDKGPKRVSVARLLAHELGHLTGAKDNKEMDNVNKWENPIMEQLGEDFKRTKMDECSCE